MIDAWFLSRSYILTPRSTMEAIHSGLLVGLIRLLTSAASNPWHSTFASSMTYSPKSVQMVYQRSWLG